MRSLRFLLSRRWLLFALVVLILCYATWWLGEWQFHRLAERKASNEVIRTNEDRPPAPVTDVLSPKTPVSDDDEWRLVTATGTYDTADTVIVRYRTRDGQSGVDAVVPLVTADGTALLVDRGWMASDNQGAGPDELPDPPTGEVQVVGWLRADTTGSATTVDDHSTRAISSTEIGQAIDRPVFRGFVQLKSENGKAADGLLPVELPELNNGPHFFYGLQWWFFGLLAVVGFVYLAYDELRGRGRGEEPEGDRVVSERATARAARNARKQAVRAAYQRAYEEERRQRQGVRNMPPSTGTIAPDTNDAAGESRNAATRPNSSGTP